MKLHSFGNEFLFDDFCTSYQSGQKLFFTTLVHMEKLKLPEIWPKIYTNEILKNQLILFLKNNKNIILKDDQFHVLKPFESEMISLNDGTLFEVLLCEPKGIVTSVMLVFRQDGRITHLYTGVCSDIRGIMLNRTFADWLEQSSSSINALYTIVAQDIERCTDCELEDAFTEIESKMNNKFVGKVILTIPLFGYETFICHMASEYRGYIAICGFLRDFYKLLPKAEMNYFTDDLYKAKLILCDKNMAFDFHGELEQPTEEYDIKWSPLPSNFELDILTKLVRPYQLLDINYKLSFTTATVPIKLRNHSRHTTTISSIREMERSIEVYDSLLIPKSNSDKEIFFQQQIEEILQNAVELIKNKQMKDLNSLSCFNRLNPVVRIKRLYHSRLQEMKTDTIRSNINLLNSLENNEKTSTGNSAILQQANNNRNLLKEKSRNVLKTNNPADILAKKLIDKNQQSTNTSTQADEIPTTSKKCQHSNLAQQNKTSQETLPEQKTSQAANLSNVLKKANVYTQGKRAFKFLDDDSD